MTTDIAKKIKDRLNRRVCLHCEEDVDEYLRVGGCVYAEPCGCRQYQGELPKEKDAESNPDI